MTQAARTLEAIVYKRGSLRIINQLMLPFETVYEACDTVQQGFDAIRSMKVRGAPAIAIVAALSLAVEMETRRASFGSASAAAHFVSSSLAHLRLSRPTAVNLFEAAARLDALVATAAVVPGASSESVVKAYLDAAEQMLKRDVADNKAIGKCGADFILNHRNNKDKVRVLTHCNTGSLATAGWGTALGIIRDLHQRDALEMAFCTETRPYNQGGRLTAYELVFEGIPGTLVTDSMVSALLAQKDIAAIVVGADRVTANGDTANKIGTYQLAIAAKYHGVPFIVAAPSTSIDLSLASGDMIPIEQRPGVEVVQIRGQVVDDEGNLKEHEGDSADVTTTTVNIAANGINVWNPSFDVTPADLISAIATEKGIVVKAAGSKVFDVKAFLSHGGRRQLDPAFLRQLGIPSFKEFRTTLKSDHQPHRQASKPHTIKPSASTASSTSSLSKETTALLSTKSSTSSSGLSDLELNALHSLLSTDTTHPRFSSHNMIDTSNDAPLLKIEDNYIGQFAAPQWNSARALRESAQVSKLIRNTVVVEGTLTLEQITSVVRVNALTGRCVEAQEAFELIRGELGREPDTVAINTLMDAYARVGDYKNAARVFKEFHHAEAEGTAKPDLFSYSILIKACVYGGRLKSAFDVYEAMKLKGINPSLFVYTTLIKGCIDTRDLPRAWKTYHHMIEEICLPDATTYTLMIHACALDSNAERALELFTQMHEKGLVATEVTYTSLLQALGSRKDYYQEVWGLVGQMVEKGWKVNLVGCKVLMKVCAGQGDLARLRTVWNWIVAQAAEGDESMHPDASTYRTMFHALGQCVRVSRRASRGTHPKPVKPPSPYADQDPSLSLDAPTTTTTTTEESSLLETPPTTPQPYTFISPIPPTHALQRIHLTNPETNPHAILADANALWTYALETIPREARTAEVVDAYLGVYCACPGNIVAASRALEIYDGVYEKEVEVKKNGEAASALEKEEVGSESSLDASASLESDKDATPVSTTTAVESSSSSNDSSTLSESSLPLDGSASSPNARAPVVESHKDSTPVSQSESTTTSSNDTTALTLVPKTGWTFQLILDIVTKDKKLMRARGSEIWADYMRWDAAKESALVGLTPAEKEAVRVREGRGRGTMKKEFALMARGYAKINEITPALDTIEAATIFRNDPAYLPAIVFDDVSNLVDKIRDLAEEGDLAPAKRLKELCPPPPPKNAEEEVRQMLRNKWSGGKNWWGWESLGIDENVRTKIIRKQKKEADRVKAYWANKRNNK
ncbi:S-methyl-5-thioribose-1-phosphate isomerase [Podochytrium sp. JEL0797]|nr:S-methyl-5-thioribose-1-phosphate isomerase [Podochytrium sp. JEL0797]